MITYQRIESNIKRMLNPSFDTTHLNALIYKTYNLDIQKYKLTVQPMTAFLMYAIAFSIDLGVGTMLKGMGRVVPSSIKDIHSLARANFHSMSSHVCQIQMTTTLKVNFKDQQGEEEDTFLTTANQGFPSLKRCPPPLLADP